MVELIGQKPGSGEAGEPATGLAEGFKAIGELARSAARGNESAKLALEIIRNQQLAEIQNLELVLRVLQIQNVTRVASGFTLLSGVSEPGK